MKYCHRCITFMVSPKHLLKMAQLEPVKSKHGMAAGSLSTVIGMMYEDDTVVNIVGREDTEDLGEGLGEELGV